MLLQSAIIKCKQMIRNDKQMIRKHTSCPVFWPCFWSLHFSQYLLDTCLWRNKRYSSVISACLWEVDGYGVARCRVAVMIVWVGAGQGWGFSGPALALAFMHSSYLGLWCFFRWLKKLVVLPCGADTTLWHSLHTTSFWSTSLALNPKNLHTIDVDPLQGTSSSPPDAAVLSLSASNICLTLTLTLLNIIWGCRCCRVRSLAI